MYPALHLHTNPCGTTTQEASLLQGLGEHEPKKINLMNAFILIHIFTSEDLSKSAGKLKEFLKLMDKFVHREEMRKVYSLYF